MWQTVTLVRGTFLKPDNSPWIGLKCRARPIASSPLRTGADTTIPSSVSAIADSAGLISMTLHSSYDYDPATPYVFEFTDPTTNQQFTLMGIVPIDDTTFGVLDPINSLGLEIPEGFVTPQMMKLESGTPTDGKLIRINGREWDQVDESTGGGSGGLTESEVDTRVGVLVEDFAEVGNAATIPTAKIADDAITRDKIADNAVDTDQIADGSINNLKLEDAIIDNDKIEDDGIGSGKIATSAAADIKGALETLTGTSRLDASAVQNIPSTTPTPLSDDTPRDIAGVGDSGTSTSASRSDHEHKLNTEFSTHVITVGADSGSNEFYGFREDTSGIGAFGSTDDASSSDQTLRAIYQGENGGIVFVTTPGILDTGLNSQEDLAIEIDGFEIDLKDMTRTVVTVNSVPAVQYRIVDTTTRIPRTVGDTFTLKVRGPVQAKIDRLEGEILAQVEDFAEVGNTATIPTAKIADNAVTTDKLASLSVTANRLANGSVVTNKIADNAVTTVKIADGAVQSAAIALEAVGAPQIQNSAIDDRIADWAESGNTDLIPDDKIVLHSEIHEFEITIGHDSGGVNYGYHVGTFGSGNDLTFEFGGNNLTVQRLSQIGGGQVTLSFGFALPATGEESVANSSFELAGVIYYFSEMITTDRILFRFQAPQTAIYTATVGSTITARVRGSIVTSLDRLRTAVETNTDDIAALPATATPQPVADAGAVGSSDKLALEDHEHASDRLTEAQVDERISALSSNRDVIATGSFTRAATTGGGVGVNNLALAFTPESGTEITIGRISQDTTSRAISITTTPFNTRASVVGYKIAIGDDIVLAFEEASFSLGDDPPGPGINPDGYIWEGGHALIPSGVNTVEIFEPIDKDNYVPGGGTTGQLLGNVDGVPEWEDAGGAGGQIDTSRILYVHQWKRAAAKPAVSELSGSDWDNAGWITTGTGWFGRPDEATGTESLWHAITTASYDGSNWTLGTWSIHIADAFNVRYFNNSEGTGASTSTPSASTRSFQRRDPDTGQWGPVLTFGTEILYWKWFVNTNMSGVTSSSSVKVVNFPGPVDFSKVRDIRVSVQLYSGSALVLYGDAYLAPRSPFAIATALDTLVQPNERICLRASTEDGVKLFMASTVIGNHGSGSTTDFECDFFFRQTSDTSDGHLVAKDVRFYRFGSWNQNAVVQMFWR